MNKYLKSASLTYVAQVVILALSFAINVFTVRLLGAYGKGVISILQNYFMISVVVFMLGMSEGNIFYLGRKTFSHRTIFSNTLVHFVAISIIFIIISLILKRWLIVAFLKNVQPTYYNIAIGIFPVFFLFLHLTSMLLGHKNIKYFNFITITRFALIFLLLIALVPRFGIAGALFATILGFGIADIFGLVKLWKNGSPQVKIDVGYLRKSFIFGAKSYIGLILSQLDRRLDVFIINLFLDPTRVGFYAVAVAMAEFPWYISNAFATVLFPEVSSMNREEAFRFTATITRNTLFIVGAFGLILFFIGGFLMQFIFGDQFVQSFTALRLLIPGVVILSVNKVICAGFSGTGKPEYGTLTATFSAIATVALDLLLIPRYGINGAALASSIAYIVSALTGIILFHKTSRVPLKDILFVKSKDITNYPKYISSLLGGKKHA